MSTFGDLWSILVPGADIPGVGRRREAPRCRRSRKWHLRMPTGLVCARYNRITTWEATRGRVVRAGAAQPPLEIPKIPKKPRFSGFGSPQLPWGSPDPPGLGSRRSGSQPRYFHRIALGKCRIGVQGTRKASQGVRNIFALAQEPYAGRRSGPGRPTGSPGRPTS